MSSLGINLFSDVRPAYIENAIYMPIVKISEYQKEQAARWLDGSRSARLLFPDGSSNTYAANGSSLYSTMVTNLGSMSNNLPAINNLMAINDVRKHALPGFFKGHSISQLTITRALKTGSLDTVGQLYDNWLLIDDTHMVCVYASGASLRAGYLTRTGDNWVLTSSKQLVTTDNSQNSQNIRLISIDTYKYLATYVNVNGGTSTPRAVAFTVVTGTITEGAAVNLGNSTSVLPSPQKISANNVLIAGYNGSTSKSTAWVVTASGVTLTVAATNDKASGGGGSSHQFFCRILTSTKALITAFQSGSSNVYWIATITGTSVSHGTDASGFMSPTSVPRDTSIFTKNASGVWIGTSDGKIYAVDTSGATPTLAATIVAGSNYNSMTYDAANNRMHINGSIYDTSTFGPWTLVGSTLDVAGFGNPFSTGDIIVGTTTGVAYSYAGAQVEVTVRSPDGDSDNDEDTITVVFGTDLSKTVNVNSNFYRKSYFDIKNISSEAVSFSISNCIVETL